MANGQGQGTGEGGDTVAEVGAALAEYTPAEPPKVDEGGEGKIEEGKAPPPKEGEGEGEGEVKPEERIAELEGKIAELTTQLAALPKLGAQPPTPPAEEKFEPAKYFEKPEDFENAFEAQDKFEGLLGKVEANASTKAVTEILKRIPSVVTNLVNTQLTMRRSIDKFYDDNKDLADKKQFVGHVADDLMGKNPGWKLDKLFTELGKEVRTRLGQKGGAQPPRNPGGPIRRPGSSRLPARREAAPEGLEGEIVDLLQDEGIKR